MYDPLVFNVWWRGPAEARIISPSKIREVKRMDKIQKSGNAQTDTKYPETGTRTGKHVIICLALCLD